MTVAEWRVQANVSQLSPVSNISLFQLFPYFKYFKWTILTLHIMVLPKNIISYFFGLFFIPNFYDCPTVLDQHLICHKYWALKPPYFYFRLESNWILDEGGGHPDFRKVLFYKIRDKLRVLEPSKDPYFLRKVLIFGDFCNFGKLSWPVNISTLLQYTPYEFTNYNRQSIIDTIH